MAEAIRVDLSEFQEGAWADLRPVVPWGLVKKIGTTVLASGDSLGAVDVVVRGIVSGWNVADDEGRALPAPSECTDEQLEGVDARIITAINEAAKPLLERIRGKADGASTS